MRGIKLNRSINICGGDCENCNQFQKKVGKSEVVLTKRKVQKKYLAPDTSALKLLMELQQGDYGESQKFMFMTDEELNSLEITYLNMLLQNKNNFKEENV